jgi:minor extracellular serine protease Vpr
MALPLFGARLEEYALVLNDPPLARQVTPRSQIETAQQQVRGELARRKIRVTGSAETLLNAVFVRMPRSRAADLRGIAGVKHVIWLPPLKRNLNVAVNLLNIPAAWSALPGGMGNAGAGVKIAVIDSGIDNSHPAFQDASLTPPATYPRGNTTYTNGKIIVARSYESLFPLPDDPTPQDRSGHGTALAMIAAGETVTAPLATITGVAPKAWLGNYKIFGTPGLNDTTTYDALIQALEDAVTDQMDIAVLALGNLPVSGPLDQDAACANNGVPLEYQDDCDIAAYAVQNAVGMGMTVVVAAGNDAQSGYLPTSLNSINSPGTAPAAITVGAVTNGHLLFSSVRVSGSSVPSVIQVMDAAVGDGVKLDSALTATIKDVTTQDSTGLACSALPGGSFTGDIVLIVRGTCDFSTKINNAQQAGASGVIIYQDPLHLNDLPFSDLGAENTGIPAVMIYNQAGVALASYLGSSTNAQATLDPTLHLENATPNLVTEFTSRGPSIDYSIKPELAAMGEGIYTATESLDPTGDLWDASGYTSVEGTSFAAALVAGTAALVKQANPNFSAAQIKSALVNTANASEVTDPVGDPPVISVGGGELNATAVLKPGATIAPATVSFGWVGSNSSIPITVPLTITNTGGNAATFTVLVTPDPLVFDADTADTVTVSPASLQLDPGQQGNINVSLNGTFTVSGIYDGAIVIAGPGTTLRVPYWYMESDGNVVNLLPVYDGSFSGTVGDTCWYLALKVMDDYGIPVSGVPVTFSVEQGGGTQSTSSSCPAGIAPGPSGTTNGYGIAWTNVDLGTSIGTQLFEGAANGLAVSFYGMVRPSPSIGSVKDAASFQAGKGLAPGSYISIFGAALSDATQALSTDFLPYAISAVSVSFYSADGSQSWAGRLWYASPTQINVQVPWELAGLTSANVTVNVGDVSLPYTIAIAPELPAMFEANGLAVAQDENYQLITAANPAQPGQYVILYANGLGAVVNPPASGEITPSGTPDATVITPTVTIGKAPAQVLFSGLTPGSIGLYQIDVVIPANAPSGVQPIVITENGVSSQPANLPVK